VGHAESASGVTSLIKVLLMLQKNLIPPHCGIKTRINHTFPTDFDERNVHIAFKPTPWNPPKVGPRRAFVNNFSAAGGNTALLLEEGPKYTEVARADPRSTHVVTLTAKSRTALQKNINSLISFMDKYSNDTQNNTEFLGRLSYTLTARRIHHPYRVAVCGSTVVDIQSSLEAVDCNTVKPVSASPGPVVFVFTGQGAQYAGMGQHLFANLSEFRTDMLMFDTMVRREGLPSILPLVDGTVSADTPNSEIDPLVLQLGATCLQLALIRFWKSLGIQPRYVIGHSLGEYAALTAAGVLTASDTIQLACARARLLQRYCHVGTHSMLAVRASRESLAPNLNSNACEVACVNGPEDTVISGRESAISSLAEQLKADGVKCTKLQVPYAFHSSQVDPILDDLEEAARAVTFHEPAIPVISSLLGDVVTNGGVFGPQYLRRHCREKVDFHGALVAAQQSQVTPLEKTIWLEVGSHPICSAMIKSTVGVKSTTLPTMHRKEETWKTLSGTLASLYLAGVEPSWREYHRDFAASQRVLQLPTYNWDNKNYWIQYKHSWALTKGDAPKISESEAQSNEDKFSTSSVQSIVSENQESNGATVVMQSDLVHPELQRMCKGHLLNGVPLCPSVSWTISLLHETPSSSVCM
jgi:naphtho-gamma-pyrone polyketide synthase